MADVSPVRGHGPLASRGVTAAPAPSHPVLYSQFRGPFLYNETEEERKKREEDEAKQTNFDKLRQAREADKARADAEKARADAAEAKLREREEADRKAADAKLAEEGKLKELADQRQKDAEAAAADAAREKARADTAEARVKAFEDQQEAELAEVLKTIPDDKKPPLDPADPVSKRLQQAKYAASLIARKPDEQIGSGARKGTPQEKKDRVKELLKKPRRTEEESMELAELTEADE